MKERQYSTIVNKAIELLDKVSVTGRKEALELIECSSFLNAFNTGELTIVNTPGDEEKAPKEPQEEPKESIK